MKENINYKLLYSIATRYYHTNNLEAGKGYWRGSKYLYVCNNNTIYLLGSDAGIHHVTEELPSNLEAKVREYKP